MAPPLFPYYEIYFLFFHIVLTHLKDCANLSNILMREEFLNHLFLGPPNRLIKGQAEYADLINAIKLPFDGAHGDSSIFRPPIFLLTCHKKIVAPSPVSPRGVACKYVPNTAPYLNFLPESVPGKHFIAALRLNDANAQPICFLIRKRSRHISLYGHMELQPFQTMYAPINIVYKRRKYVT